MRSRCRFRLRQLAALMTVVVIVSFIYIRILTNGGENLPLKHQPNQDNEQQLPKEEVQEAFNKNVRDPDQAPWEIKQSRGHLLIPTKIHHYFSNTTHLPSQLLSPFVSWASKNPNYTVYFWNAAYVEQNLLPRYPQYSKYYWRDSTSHYERDLIAKVLILYSVGGVLVDKHMRSLHGITEYISDLTCVMAQERTEKAVILYGFEVLPSTSLIACTANHAFLKFFLRKITDVSFRTGARILQVNSAPFLVHVYLAAISEFDDNCKSQTCDYRDRLILAEPQVFLPIIEQSLYESLVTNCQSASDAEYLKKEACYNLELMGNKPTARSIATPVYKKSLNSEQDLMLPISTVEHAVRRKVQLMIYESGK